MNDENLTSPGEDADSDGGNGGGRSVPLAPNFGWTCFYEAMADKILACRNQPKRGELLAKSCEIDRNLAGKKLDDICPFSVMARFNRGRPAPARHGTRVNFAKGLASDSFFGISEPAPETCEYFGIPVISRGNPLFFDPEKRKPDDIDTMWELFACALALAKSDRVETREAFVCSYDKALGVHGVEVPKLTIGLFWIRPWFFLPLDKWSRGYIKEELRISDNPLKEGSSGEGYLALRKKLVKRFEEKTCPVRSFPALACEDPERG